MIEHANGGMPSLRRRVVQIISDQIGKRVEEPRILDTSEFGGDLQFDSLDRVTMVFAVEDAFHVEISDVEESGLVTVRDLISLLERKLNVRATA
jgi:acyl carrier protein